MATEQVTRGEEFGGFPNTLASGYVEALGGASALWLCSRSASLFLNNASHYIQFLLNTERRQNGNSSVCSAAESP